LVVPFNESPVKKLFVFSEGLQFWLLRHIHTHDLLCIFSSSW
jgi:hypothetical protein